jgi:hypothetical protein
MLFNTAAEGFERAGGNKGCAIGTVTLDLTEADSGIRELCGATFDSWIDLLAPHLPWRSERSRRSFALLVVAAIEGAFILGRAKRSGEPFREAGKWLAAMVASNGPGGIQRSLPKPKPPRKRRRSKQ